jgi:hypothetical protein
LVVGDLGELDQKLGVEDLHPAPTTRQRTCLIQTALFAQGAKDEALDLRVPRTDGGNRLGVHPRAVSGAQSPLKAHQRRVRKHGQPPCSEMPSVNHGTQDFSHRGFHVTERAWLNEGGPRLGHRRNLAAVAVGLCATSGLATPSRKP